ncbi:hypothetical protein AX769_13525 [Frondihabitans sp. PAMC 28766]|uniref:hypothetical protein n=1 Tax=Frondihabitans sp. PAMC 28766 TaxID=1795630 RepID=UPI00078CCDF4|nr:hypothetical protein [Frondihabitans sp. PAMC 28766]AMM20966.1 hypothetical protein AX769_13525 [Frondihabitans sp. PAMC 28766]
MAEDDDQDPRVLGWVHRHTELLWVLIGVVFLIYGVNAIVQLAGGVVGPDYSNVISSFGGVIAAIVAGILALRGRAERRRAGDDD